MGHVVLSATLLTLLLAPPTAAHELSVSHSRLEVRGDRAALDVRCQTLSLIEAIVGLDADGDGVLVEDELAAGRGAIGAYLEDRYRLQHPDGDAFAATLSSLGFAAELEDEDRRFQWIDMRLEFAAAREIEALDVHSRLFTERDPYHRDFLTLTWNDDLPAQHLFLHGEHDWEFHPAHVRRPGVLVTFVRLGVDHILTGYDHLCFLLVLIVAARTLRSLVGVVTAFTLAHSITLALAALDVADLDQGFVELAIALSIAYVAAENLVLRRARTPWLEAFVFGLLHGLGFAGFLGEALVGEDLVLTALVGFNLGVEVGQLVFVAGFAITATLLFRRWRAREGTEEDRMGVVPPWFRRGASAVVAAVALYWFVQRTGWLG